MRTLSAGFKINLSRLSLAFCSLIPPITSLSSSSVEVQPVSTWLATRGWRGINTVPSGVFHKTVYLVRHQLFTGVYNHVSKANTLTKKGDKCNWRCFVWLTWSWSLSVNKGSRKQKLNTVTACKHVFTQKKIFAWSLVVNIHVYTKKTSMLTNCKHALAHDSLDTSDSPLYH